MFKKIFEILALIAAFCCTAVSPAKDDVLNDGLSQYALNFTKSDGSPITSSSAEYTAMVNTFRLCRERVVDALKKGSVKTRDDVAKADLECLQRELSPGVKVTIMDANQ